MQIDNGGWGEDCPATAEADTAVPARLLWSNLGSRRDKSGDYWGSWRADARPVVPLRGGTGPHEIAGKQRYCVYLPAPSAFGGDKKFEKLLPADRLEKIRSFLLA